MLSRYTSPKILDFGCGYGQSTTELISEGFDVWGVDISAAEIERAPREIRDRLTVLDEDGRAPFPEGHFDVVYSMTVFEHVADLETAVAEIVRLTAPGGVGAHEWPAKWTPIEPHLRMPFVHWLPKNGIRRAAIHAFIKVGIGPPWPPELPKEATRRELAEFEYRYSVARTFYRPFPAVTAAFHRHGFRTEFQRSKRLAKFGPAAPAAEWANREFRTARLVTFAPAA